MLILYDTIPISFNIVCVQKQYGIKKIAFDNMANEYLICQSIGIIVYSFLLTNAKKCISNSLFLLVKETKLATAVSCPMYTYSLMGFRTAYPYKAGKPSG